MGCEVGKINSLLKENITLINDSLTLAGTQIEYSYSN